MSLPDWEDANVRSEWKDHLTTYPNIGQMPLHVFGFIYLIEFVDGTKYIGKKNLYTVKTIKALKSGKPRENAIKQIHKNTGKGSRITFDVVKVESDWLTYTGSSKECYGRIPKRRYILDFAYSSRELTYLEAKYLFTEEVLENPVFLNSNILGTFFKGNINGSEENEESVDSNQKKMPGLRRRNKSGS